MTTTRTSLLALAACLLPQSLHAADTSNQLQLGSLTVTLDTHFPRIISYQTPKGAFDGQTTAVSLVELNETATTAQVSFKKISATTGLYTLLFPKEKVTIDLQIQIEKSSNAVDLRLTRLEESGTFKVKTFALPQNDLLSTPATPSSELAFTIWDMEYTWGPETLNWLPGGHYRSVIQEEIAPIKNLKPGNTSGTYLFLANDSLSGGIASSNYSARKRVQRSVTGTPDALTCHAQNPIWEIRTFEDEAPELPWVKVFITADRNDDQKCTWQDAALVYRETMPKPYGHEFVKSSVAENIAMNFASGAQQPFLKILDEIKKGYLATDGLGQHVIIKGYSSEGHDSANTDYTGHWNERAGGLNDLNTLLENAHAWNARVGIHINTSEFYPESNRFDPKFFDCTVSGIPRNGWVWLDQSIMINQTEDFRHGSAMAQLNQMRIDLPKLDFVYVDTFLTNGWPARELARKLHSLNLPIYTECAAALDPWSVWIHSRNNRSAVVQFLWFSERDVCSNDPILRAGRADDDGFMGWQNRHNFHSFVRNTFRNRLPAKFLQHFQLLQWTPGQSARFSDHLNIQKDGNTIRTHQNDQLLMQWDHQCNHVRYLIPWTDSSTNTQKLYAWSDDAGAQTWTLPTSWQTHSQLYLYQLGHQGRMNETTIPVQQGKITLDLTPGSPYVLVAKANPTKANIAWGQGCHLQNPGFDDASNGWTTSGSVTVASDARGNERAVASEGEARLSQKLVQLKPNTTYAATAWVQSSAPRKLELTVEIDKTTHSSYTDRCDIPHKAPNDARSGSNYQRLRTLFTTPANTASITLHLSAAAGPAKSTAEFDDIRIVETNISRDASKHDFYEDFENIESGGYGPFTCCPNENTHLSEANPPHTHDVIAGKYSLKTRGASAGRTIPATLRLKPNTTYKISCLTLGKGKITAISNGSTVMDLPFDSPPTGNAFVDTRKNPVPDCYTPRPLTGTFTTSTDPNSYLTLNKEGGDFIAIDNLAIDEVKR